jgi:PAS domain S-box-containing protein
MRMDEIGQIEPAPHYDESQFRALVDASPVAIWVTNPDGGLRYANQAYLAFFGVSRQEARGGAWKPLIHPEEAPAYLGAFAEALARQAPFEAEARVRRHDGEWRWVASQARPHHDAAGRFLGYVGLSPDVTEHLRTEAALRASRAELAALAGRLDAALEEERARIAGDLHDELGQLLTALKMDLRAMERRLEAVDGPDGAALLEQAMDASELASRAITTVQEIAAELRPGVLGPLGLEAALEQEARQFARRSGVDCRLETTGLVPPLSAEVAMALYRIAAEALTNVARHAEAAHVTLRLELDGEAVLLRIDDDGRGIDPAHLGPALGLTSMRQRAERLGGAVQVGRRAGGGTVVAARLPLGAMAPVVASPFEQSFHAALENFPNPVYVHRPDGSVEFINRHLREYTGRSLGSLQDGRHQEVFHPDDLERARAAWLEAQATGVASVGLFRLRQHDGAYRRFKCAIAPVHDHLGRVVRWVGSWTDVEDLLPGG